MNSQDHPVSYLRNLRLVVCPAIVARTMASVGEDDDIASTTTWSSVGLTTGLDSMMCCACPWESPRVQPGRRTSKDKKAQMHFVLHLLPQVPASQLMTCLIISLDLAEVLSCGLQKVRLHGPH